MSRDRAGQTFGGTPATFTPDSHIASAGRERLEQTVGGQADSVPGINVANISVYAVANYSPDRIFDARNTSLDEMADVLATLITDLQTAANESSGSGSAVDTDGVLELENP